MIWAIGDLHLDNTKEKEMDIFGENWIDHDKKIFDDWKSKVESSDIVLLPGDISWGLKLSHAEKDLKAIDSMPGKKFLSKGNHDYWWSGVEKMNNLGFSSLNFIHNTGFIYKDIGICGTRGWVSKDSPEFNEKDEKIYTRELHRLESSIISMNSKGSANTRIALIHYPPFNQDFTPNEFSQILQKHKIDICLYGHLHDKGHEYIREGYFEDVYYHCVSSDYLNFKLKRIEI